MKVPELVDHKKIIIRYPTIPTTEDELADVRVPLNKDLPPAVRSEAFEVK